MVLQKFIELADLVPHVGLALLLTLFDQNIPHLLLPSPPPVVPSYRCDPDRSPEDLTQRQKDVWDPLLESLKTKHGITLDVVSGMQMTQHPEESMRAAEDLFETVRRIKRRGKETNK